MQDLRFLQDVKESNGKSVDWKGHKIHSSLLSDSFQRLGNFNKSFRCAQCGDTLAFERLSDGTLKLRAANFCQMRLCPMCSWRRSLKIFGQTSKVMDYITKENNFRYIFLTLTVKNVPGAELSKEIDLLFAAYEKLTRRKEFKKIAKGTFRCLEVTHNWERGDDYHPHFHVIVAVIPSYFCGSSSGYLSHKKLMELWRDCAGLDYDPWVHVQTVKPKNGEHDGTDIPMDYGKAVAEVAKYTVKATDFIVKPPELTAANREYYKRLKKWADDETDKVVAVLDKALAKRRLVAFGGVMRDAHKKLKLDCPVDGDLVNTDNEVNIRPNLWAVIEKYKWCSGYKNYVLDTDDYDCIPSVQADETSYEINKTMKEEWQRFNEWAEKQSIKEQ